uniref:Putative rna polymerase i transcription factor uaf n=2 Tax=Ixodes TaxID=6944 RepID=A0A147BUD4_IXORI
MAELPAAELRKAIAEILDGADLDVLSSKKIRKQLEQKYGIDFTDRKKEIDGIVMALISEQAKAKPEPKEENGDAGGNSSAGSSHDDNDDGGGKDDAELARQLQDEEFRSRSRAVKKSRTVKKEPKSAKKEAKPKGTKRETAYSRKCALSPELAAVMGSDQMARHDVVKRMWGIFRERELIDPSNKRFGICDPELLRVFGQKRVRIFGMMKYLKNHIKDVK